MDREIMVGSEVSLLAKLHVRKTGQPSGKGTVECAYSQLIIHGEKIPGGTIDIPYHILQIHKPDVPPVPVVIVKVNGLNTEVPVTKELVKALGFDPIKKAELAPAPGIAPEPEPDASVAPKEFYGKSVVEESVKQQLEDNKSKSEEIAAEKQFKKEMAEEKKIAKLALHPLLQEKKLNKRSK